MTDTTENLPDASLDDVRARNKKIVFAALAAAAIQRVTVEYDGAGDSGQIENVEAWGPANERIPFPSEPRIHLVSENPDLPYVQQSLQATVETVTWHYLDDLYSGWENNDGAWGTFVFDVPARTVTLEHNERFTDVNTTSHEF